MIEYYKFTCFPWTCQENQPLSFILNGWLLYRWIVLFLYRTHPIYAYADKAESERDDMRKRVDNIMRKHKVDMYICGHIHNFQHIRHKESDIDYVVNKSGSQSRNTQPSEGTVFCNGTTGFSQLAVSKDSMSLYMIDRDGNVIHKIHRSR